MSIGSDYRRQFAWSCRSIALGPESRNETIDPVQQQVSVSHNNNRQEEDCKSGKRETTGLW